MCPRVSREKDSLLPSSGGSGECPRDNGSPSEILDNTARRKGESNEPGFLVYLTHLWEFVSVFSKKDKDFNDLSKAISVS